MDSLLKAALADEEFVLSGWHTRHSLRNAVLTSLNELSTVMFLPESESSEYASGAVRISAMVSCAGIGGGFVAQCGMGCGLFVGCRWHAA